MGEWVSGEEGGKRHRACSLHIATPGVCVCVCVCVCVLCVLCGCVVVTQEGDVIGVGIDFDANCMWWSLAGVREQPAFFGPFGDGLMPALCMISQGMMGDGLRVNFGQEAFVHPPPAEYLPLVNPGNMSSSWMTRFEHGVAVVETVHTRSGALPPSVVAMAFASETAESESKPLPLTFHSKSATLQMGSSPFVSAPRLTVVVTAQGAVGISLQRAGCALMSWVHRRPG